MALRWDPTLKAVHERELERGNRNRATVAVARKLVARLPAVDKRYSRFMAALKASGIGLDRRSLAELAVREPAAFEAVVEAAKKGAKV